MPYRVGHVLQRAGIDEPRAHRGRITAENLLELGHVRIDELLALLRFVARRKADIGMPVPRVGSPPLHSGRFDMGLGDFPPAAHFGALGESLFHQGLIFRIDQRVVLQQKSSFQAMPAEQLGLGERSPVQLLVGYIHRRGSVFRTKLIRLTIRGARSSVVRPLRAHEKRKTVAERASRAMGTKRDFIRLKFRRLYSFICFYAL